MHIDWTTLALQTVNVLVLVWLLARFLFRPVKAIIAERSAAAERLLADAVAARAQGEADAAEIRNRLSKVSIEAERMLADARAQAEAERTRLSQQTADAATKAQNDAQAAIDNDRVSMEQVLRQKACDLAIVIAKRLVLRLPARTATAALLESLTMAVTELPEEQRRNMAAAGGQSEVVSATSLDECQRTACQDMMYRLLGQMPALAFRTDPSLIAGVELHTPGMLIRNSWRADLEHIAGELRQDEQHAAESEHLV